MTCFFKMYRINFLWVGELINTDSVVGKCGGSYWSSTLKGLESHLWEDIQNKLLCLWGVISIRLIEFILDKYKLLLSLLLDQKEGCRESDWALASITVFLTACTRWQAVWACCYDFCTSDCQQNSNWLWRVFFHRKKSIWGINLRLLYINTDDSNITKTLLKLYSRNGNNPVGYTSQRLEQSLRVQQNWHGKP